MTSINATPSRQAPVSEQEIIERLERVARTSHPDHTITSRERRLLEELVSTIDGLPLSVEIVADAIRDCGITRARVQVEQGLLAHRFDTEAWGFDWHTFSATQRDVLRWAIQCHGAFDRRSVLDVVSASEGHVALAELVELGWLIECVDAEVSGLYVARWCTRMLLSRLDDLCPGAREQRRHATYFIERMEAVESSDVREFEVRNLRGAVLDMLSVEPDLAASAALVFVHCTMFEGRFEETTTLIEQVVARRAYRAEDLLGARLSRRLGECYRVQKRFDESIVALERALAIIPEDERALLFDVRRSLALSLLSVGEHARATRIAREVEASCAMHEYKGRDIVRALQPLVSIAFYTHDYELAADLLARLLEAAPNDVTVHSNLAGLLSLTGDVNTSRTHTEIVMRLLSEEPGAYHEILALNNAIPVDLCLGEVQAAAGRLVRLEEIFSTLEDSRSSLWSLSLLNKSLFLLHRGDLLEALTVVDRFLELSPNEVSMRAMQVALMTMLGDSSRARHAFELYEESLALAPLTPEIVPRYMSFIRQLGEAHIAKEQGEFEALLRGLDTFERTSESCMMQVMFDQLHDHVRTMVLSETTLRVHEEGFWVQRGLSGELVDLRRSRVARKLLLALASKAGTPSHICSFEELFDAVWPGEVWNQSSRVRLHTAVHRLRDRVLGELLVTHDDEGYSLSRSCQIHVLMPHDVDVFLSRHKM